jgi:hypothetical protein
MIGALRRPLPSGYISHWLCFKAGAGGGLAASIATCPLDVIKTRLQAQRVIQGQQGYEGVIGKSPNTNHGHSRSTSKMIVC